MANITSIPAPRVPLIDQRTGLISREWYRFFINVAGLVGSGENDISISELLILPPEIGEVTQQSDMLGIDPPVNYCVDNYSLDQVVTLISDQHERISKLNDDLTNLPIMETGEFLTIGNISTKRIPGFTSYGNVTIDGFLTLSPGSSVTPANNGNVVFELTSNTSLTIRAKGSDGIVRSGAIVLA